MRSLAVALPGIISLLLSASAAKGDSPIEVEPGELTTRRDLINREVVVDDRVRIYLPHPGRGIDEIELKRTPVVFHLPQPYRLSSAPSSPAVRIQGILKRDGTNLYCDVTAAPRLLPSDVVRFETSVASLPDDDVSNRTAWAEWGLRRAKAFEDAALKEKASRLYSEIFSREATRPDITPEALLKLAGRARSIPLPEAESSALAHQAFRARVATTTDPERLAADIQDFFPESNRPRFQDQGRTPQDYARNPGATYRRADPETRLALDHLLWCDAIEAALRKRSATTPQAKTQLADEAKSRLPDRTNLVAEFRRAANDAMAVNLTTLRQDELLALARTYRIDLNQPAKADSLIRTWLDDRRDHRLSSSDAEGRIDLGGLYESLLKDKAAAAALYRKALEIDPQAAPAVDVAFQKLGYVRVKGEWQSPTDSDSGAGDGRTIAGRGIADPLLGLAPHEIRTQLGKPDRIYRVVAQGKVSIQWVYKNSKGTQYIDFLQGVSDPQPIVVGRYAIR